MQPTLTSLWNLYLHRQIYEDCKLDLTHVNGVMLQYMPLSNGKCALGPHFLVELSWGCCNSAHCCVVHCPLVMWLATPISNFFSYTNMAIIRCALHDQSRPILGLWRVLIFACGCSIPRPLPRIHALMTLMFQCTKDKIWHDMREDHWVGPK